MRHTAFLLALLAIPAAYCIGQTDGVKARVQHYLDSICGKGVPGICVSIAYSDGKTIHLAGGVSDQESKQRLKPLTLLMSGSTPKMFYATLALKLSESGRLNLDDKVEKYLSVYPWYKRIPNASGITIRNVLNHTSGIMEYYELGDFMARLKKEPDKEWRPDEILSYVFDKAPLFEPGKSFRYSDTNYFILGLVIEQVSRRSVYDLVSEMILKPLQMTSTVPSVSRTIPGLSTGYSMPGSPFGFSGPTIVDGKFVVNPQFEWCGGGFASTTGDWAKFIVGLMTGKLLHEKSLILMKSGVASNIGPGELYGLGLQIRKSPLGTGYGHGGWFPGYLTEVEYFPEANVAVAIQFNTDDFSKIKAHPRNHLVRMAKLASTR